MIHKVIPAVLLVFAPLAQAQEKINPTDPQPTCRMCPGTLVLGPDIADRTRRRATMRTVVEFNGPGNGGSEIRNGVAHQIKAGDVVVIPAGTGHWFTKIDDHINYLMIRIDPDKVTPLRNEAQSMEYLSKPAPR